MTNCLAGLLKLNEYLGLGGILLGIFGLVFGFIYYPIISTSLLTMFVSFLIFSTNYPTSDPTRYYLTYVSIFNFFICLGSYFVYNQLTKYATGITIFLIFMFLLIPPLNLMKKNYQSVYKSRNNYAEVYSKNIFETIENKAVIISWWNYTTPLWYRFYVLKQRQDITIINQSKYEWKKYVDEYSKIRPVYLVEPESTVEREYKLIRYGEIYKVSSK